VEETRPADPRPAQTQPAQTQPAQRQLVVWRGDQVPVQHDIPGPGDLRDDTKTGRLLIGSLMRAQLGLSLLCLMIALTVTISFPLIAALVPSVGRMTVAGLPLTLIVLGFAFYPVFLVIGWFYNRQARQLEARFTDLVDPARQQRDD
jgi:putative solute:sodium symporter small subunit